MIEINFLHFILLALATWRLSSLFCQEDGPLGIFRKIRDKVGIVHDCNGDIEIVPNKFLCELLSCVWCFGVWVSGAMLVLYIFLPTFAIYFSLWLSFSTITIMVNEWLNVVQR
jgi:hypothetical protein